MAFRKVLFSRRDSQNRNLFTFCVVNNFQKIYRRDSFCDRFCDDLCEDILQYLSLKDKLRLQCVSKQFQRSVFQRQYELYINTSLMYRNEVYDIRKYQSMHSFKALLKKCPNITSIELNGYNYKVNEVFRLIIKNCNNLRGINVLIDLNESNFEELHQKFGPKVKYLRFFRELIDLNLFPNIEKVNILGYRLREESVIPQLKLANLKQLDIALHVGQENLFQTLVDQFPKLTHLIIYISTYGENAIYKRLMNISNLKHLIHFQFHDQSGNTNKIIYGLVKQMVNN